MLFPSFPVYGVFCRLVPNRLAVYFACVLKNFSHVLEVEQATTCFLICERKDACAFALIAEVKQLRARTRKEM